VDGRSKVQELYAHRPDRMKIVPGALGLPQGYEYTVHGEKKEFSVDPTTGVSDLLHVRRFNPLDDWYGQSPLEAMGMSVDSHNESTKWNYALLKNAARPSGALEYEGELNDDEFARLKSELTENYGSGSGDNRRQGRPMLMQGGLKWVQMMLSQLEMDWKDGKAVSAAEIAIGYNVPEQLVGVQGHQTYSNYREARMALFEDAVLPLLDRYSEALTNWFAQLPGWEGLRVGYDVDQIHALAPRREAMWANVKAADFLTTDEKRAVLGYEEYAPEDTPGGTILVSAALLPLTDAGLGGADEVPELDEEGNPLPAAAGAVAEDGALAAGGAGGSASPVQDLALNGAQIAAVVTIVQNVVDGLMPAESAIQLLLIAFPTMDEANAHALVDPAEEFEADEPEPVALPMMPGVPPGTPGVPPKKPKPPTTPVEKRVMRVVTKMTARVERKWLRRAHRLAYGGNA